jgi:hypothetical protein
MSKILRIDGKYYDFGTKNSSFLLTASELKALGIKNYYFMLEVKYPQTGVQDLDPYDPNLSPEDIGKVIMECKQNPWYFFREVSRVVARGIGEIPLYLHRAGCAAIWSFINSIDFILVQPRQTYKTTVVTAIMSYMFLFEYQNVDIPYMHTTESRCTDNVELLRDYIMALPKYMNPWANMKHPPGAQSLRYEGHNTSIAVVSAAKSKTTATDKMKGYSLFAWFVDEFEIIPFMAQVLDGSNPTIVQARQTAKAHGIRTCMMNASTPGDLETEDGQAAQKIIDNLPRFIETFYDMTEEERNNLYTRTDLTGEPEPVPITMTYIEFDYVQLRKTEDYIKAQYLEAVKTNTINEYRRGVLLQRFRGGDATLFSQSDIEYIQSHVREPNHEIFIMKKYSLYVYDHPIQHFDPFSSTPYFDTEIPYLVGLDVATGSGGDSSAMVVVHPYTLDVVAELTSPYVGVIEFMKVITVVASIIPKAIFCLEQNSIGKVITELVQHTKMEHRFYYDPQLDISKNAVRKGMDTKETMKIESKERGYIGTYVTANVRATMFQLLQRCVKDFKEHIFSKKLVDDICNLVRYKNGKIAAASGAHDDVVMAYNHVIYVLTYGYDLGRFGINKQLCTFEKSYEVLSEYESKEDDKVVNNMIPYEHPTEYEEQMRDELIEINNRARSNEVDDMGYRRSDYADDGYIPQQSDDPYDSISMKDLNSFYSMQSFPM